MISVKTLSPTFAVTGALNAEDFAEAARLGYATIINFRPDNELPGQLDAHSARRAARAAGLSYWHLPVSKFDLFADPVVSATATAISSSSRPILAYCASGQRAAIVWAAATARQAAVTEVLSALTAAKFDLDFLRDDLEAQADRSRWDVETQTTTAQEIGVESKGALEAA